MAAKKLVFINSPWVFAHPRDIVLSQNLGLRYLAGYVMTYVVGKGEIPLLKLLSGETAERVPVLLRCGQTERCGEYGYLSARRCRGIYAGITRIIVPLKKSSRTRPCSR